jgi:hypothetical protein
MRKVDICMNYYGKPYQSIVTLRSLWQQSSEHIDRIYVIIEKKQPHDRYDSIAILKFYLRDLPIIYFTPAYFYLGVGSPPTDWMEDPEKRYGLNFQYAFEHSDKEFLFVTHNDCLYKSDLLGKMLFSLEASGGKGVAGIGLIGQCWNCQAFSAKLCNSEVFEQYRPDKAELVQLVDTYPAPRTKIHHSLIDMNHIHPLPECRLNEYACLINTRIYNKEVMPKGNVVPFGGSWHGTDTGAAWFYDMFNMGYEFINFPFEPHMTHAPFSVTGSGHMNDSNEDFYNRSETNAYNYLVQNKLIDRDVPLLVKLKQYQLTANHLAGKIGSSLKSRLSGALSAFHK